MFFTAEFSVTFGFICNHCRQGNNGNYVGKNHKLVEHIRKLPNQIIGKNRAQEHKDCCQNRIDDIGLFAEKVGHIYSAEKVPADNG